LGEEEFVAHLLDPFGGQLMDIVMIRRETVLPRHHIIDKQKEDAEAYLRLFCRENHLQAVLLTRLEEAREALALTGSYWQTYEELAYGAKVAWRNSTRCIGRLAWSSLVVRDLRHLCSAEEIFQALVEHIKLATNGGKIRSTISVFAPQHPGQPGIRIWNPQLIRYAGYQQEDGVVNGDPAQAEFTSIVQKMGWQGKDGRFDILPLVIQMPYQAPRLFELPREVVLEIPIEHPEYSWFAELGIKWHALPVISNMRLEIGGVSYTAAPFNGWYMGTEIGVRNLADAQRYNLLPLIAQFMGLNTRSDRALWKDRALVELNIAVLHSFAKYGVSIVDHHTAARQFVLFEEREKHQGRCPMAQWSWIVPPMSGSTTPVFHKGYKNKILSPNYFYQEAPWREQSQAQLGGCPFHT
jgi:nitric-oxide synthase